MIVQCPSCKSRFSVDASKINSSLSKGRCSVCGHVFVLLDSAVDAMEAASLRDRLEESRAKRAKEVLGGISGAYAVSEKPVPEAKEEMAGGKEGEPYQKGASEIVEEEIAEVERREEEGEGQEEEAFASRASEEETVAGPVAGKAERTEETVPQKQVESVVGGAEEDLEEAGKGEEPASFETFGEVEAEEVDKEARDSMESGKDGAGEDGAVALDEAFEPFERPKKRTSLLPILIVVLIVLGVGGGAWFLYKTGQLSAPHGFIENLVNKIRTIRGESKLVLFDLKNEQEPATDGGFFSVRGYVQNKQKKEIPYVALKIKVYDAKNHVVLTGVTVAGRVLKAEEISKMTVQDVLKQYKAMNEMNKKTTGKLKPNQKLPFLFLFDLSKFPRKKAKTFQVEVLQPRSK